MRTGFRQILELGCWLSPESSTLRLSPALVSACATLVTAGWKMGCAMSANTEHLTGAARGVKRNTVRCSSFSRV